MDFDLVFLLMLFVFYFLSRIGGKKKPQQRPPSPQPGAPGERPSQNAELDDALREIREALGWPSDQPEETPQPQTAEPERSSVPPPSPVERRETTMEKRDRERRAAAAGREGRSRPIAQPASAPEGQPEAYAAYTGVDAAKVKPSKLDLPPPESPGASAGEKQHPILKYLKTSQGARDAVVYSEIFEPRWRKKLR